MSGIEDRIVKSPRLKELVLGTHKIWQPLLYATIVPFKNAGLLFRLVGRREIHVHFGCGRINDKRFMNVDALPFAHVHFVTKSPMLWLLRRRSVDSIYVCHVLEHFRYAEQDKILQRWIALLKPGGLLRLSVPDFDKLISSYETNDRSIQSIQADLMGAQNYPGNFHYAVFNRQHLVTLLLRAGFEDVREWHPRNQHDWPRDYSWVDGVSLNLVARKPSDEPA